MKLPIYLDYSATTPCDPRVVEKLVPYLHDHFGNPASHSHSYGWEAEKAVEEGRTQIAALIGADPREIVFTSGATEADNLAIKGAAHFYRDKQAPYYGQDRTQGRARQHAPPRKRRLRSDVS